MNATAKVDKGFRRFVVQCGGHTNNIMCDHVMAEGVQFQDGRACTRETDAAPIRKITNWDATAHISEDLCWGTEARVVWLDEDDTVVISSFFRRFIIQRDVDETGVSGTGQVVEGIQFEDGRVAFRWCANPERSTGNFDTIEAMMKIHGHDGKTRVVWVD